MRTTLTRSHTHAHKRSSSRTCGGCYEFVGVGFVAAFLLLLLVVVVVVLAWCRWSVLLPSIHTPAAAVRARRGIVVVQFVHSYRR